MFVLVIGEKDEGAASRGIGNVDDPAGVDGNGLGLLKRVILEGKKRRAIRAELVNEAAAGVSDINVAERIGGDTFRVIELAGPIALGSPLA